MKPQRRQPRWSLVLVASLILSMLLAACAPRPELPAAAPAEPTVAAPAEAPKADAPAPAAPAPTVATVEEAPAGNTKMEWDGTYNEEFFHQHGLKNRTQMYELFDRYGLRRKPGELTDN